MDYLVLYKIPSLSDSQRVCRTAHTLAATAEHMSMNPCRPPSDGFRCLPPSPFIECRRKLRMCQQPNAV